MLHFTPPFLSRDNNLNPKNLLRHFPIALNCSRISPRYYPHTTFQLRPHLSQPEDPKEAARSAIARARSSGMLDKSESTGQPTAEGDENTVTTGKSRSKNKKSNGAEVKSSGSGLKLKLSNHKSPASAGARLYQAGLINRMEQVKLRPPKPEHVKVIKHPAPFR